MNQIAENLERFHRRNPGIVIRDASQLDIIHREKRKPAEQLLDNGKGKGQENEPPYSEFPPTSARILAQKRRRERERSQNEASVSQPTTSRVDMTSPFLITPTLQCCPLQNHTPISNILTDIPERLLGNDKEEGTEDQPLDSVCTTSYAERHSFTLNVPMEIPPTESPPTARILAQRRRREREQSQHDACVSCPTTSPLLSTPTLQCCPLRNHPPISNILTDIPEPLLGNDKGKGTENRPLDSVCTTSDAERHGSTLYVPTEIPPTSARILAQRRRREREQSQHAACVSCPTTSPLLSPTLQCCPLRNHTPISNILTDIPERLLGNDKGKVTENQPLDSVCTTSYVERHSSALNVPTEIPPTSARILGQKRRRERERSQHDACVSRPTTSPLLSTPTLQSCPLRDHTPITNILTDIPERLLGNDKWKAKESQPFDSVYTASYLERLSSTLNVPTEIPPTSARILAQRRRQRRRRERGNIITPTARVVGSEEDCTRTFNLLPGNPRQQAEIRGHRSAFQCWNPIRGERSSNAPKPQWSLH